MTNAEKYNEVFGFPPDKGNCPAESCVICPISVSGCIDHYKWWDEEYKGSHAVKIEITEHHTFAKPDDVSNIDFPNSNCSEDK